MPVQPGRYGPGVPGAAWQYHYSGLTQHYSTPAETIPSGVVTQPEEGTPPAEDRSGTGSLSQASTAVATGGKAASGTGSASHSATVAATGRKEASGGPSLNQPSTVT